MENRENGRMILDSVQNGLLVWPTVTQEDGTTRKKTYAELSATKKLQADCDCKATNIILSVLPSMCNACQSHKLQNRYGKKDETLYQYYWRFAQLINNMNVINMSMRVVQVNIKFLNSLPPEWSKFVTDVKLARDLHTINYDQLVMLLVLKETIQADRQGLLNAIIVKVKDIWRCNALSLSDQGMLHGLRKGDTEDLDAYDSDCDDVSNAKAVLMANLSNYGSDVISEVPHSETYHNDMDNQSVHAMQDFEQTPVVDFSNNEIHSNSNIILYSQYLQETQQAAVQDTNFSREKMIDSQMDHMIKEKLALKQQIDSLEQNLSNQIKEKESLLQTFTVFKNESKEKETKYMENEIDLEKKIKELDNIVYKVGQSAQTVHMLIKPQAFYNNTHKQALGYQNPFYLKKAQRIKPTGVSRV
ncbi:hypothetical protein Tco_1175210 [Tanacetum coccineum]